MRFVIVAGLSLVPVFAQLPAPNGAGVSMGHLHMLVRDPEAHMKIWVETLGAKKVFAGTMPMLLLPDAVLAFRKGEPSGGTDDSAVNHLGFKTRDLDRTRAELTAAGCKVVREMPDTRQAFIMFPDNVKIEFSEDKAIPAPIVHHHIHFQSHQQDEMRAWYARTFDAVPGMRGRFKAADVPGVNLSWNPADSPMAPTKGRSLDHIGFEVRNLEAFCKKLEASGVKFDVPFRNLPQLGLSIAFFTDPWGTYIELTEGLSKLK